MGGQKQKRKKWLKRDSKVVLMQVKLHVHKCNSYSFSSFVLRVRVRKVFFQQRALTWLAELLHVVA